MTDAWEERLKATAQIQKLLAHVSGNDNQHEAEAAMGRARALAEKHGINLQEIQPALPMDTKDKLRAARANSARFAGAFNKAYPGSDDEDYTKYDAERKARAKARDDAEKEEWDGEGY